MWIKQPLRSDKGYKWVWKKEPKERDDYDETTPGGAGQQTGTHSPRQFKKHTKTALVYCACMGG